MCANSACLGTLLTGFPFLLFFFSFFTHQFSPMFHIYASPNSPSKHINPPLRGSPTCCKRPSTPPSLNRAQHTLYTHRIIPTYAAHEANTLSLDHAQHNTHLIRSFMFPTPPPLARTQRYHRITFNTTSTGSTRLFVQHHHSWHKHSAHIGPRRDSTTSSCSPFFSVFLFLVFSVFLRASQF